VADSRFLLSLPRDLRALIDSQAQTVNLKRGDQMLTAGEQFESIYFPTDCLASMVVTLENGNTVEAASVGNDGFVGVSALFGGDRTEVSVVTQIPGQALRIEYDLFVRLMREARFREVAGAFGARIFATIAQSIACMAFHPVQERLARWLLLVRDSTDRSEFPLTQDYIAVMLGVHRPTVTIAIRLLESAGLVEHRRGLIHIIDSDVLAAAACECYRLSSLRRPSQQKT
jgi:CRP-like cAMP-binding protein